MFIIIFVILISLITHLFNYLVKDKESLLLIEALPISIITLHFVARNLVLPNDDDDFIQNFRGSYNSYTSILIIISMSILIYSIIFINKLKI